MHTVHEGDLALLDRMPTHPHIFLSCGHGCLEGSLKCSRAFTCRMRGSNDSRCRGKGRGKFIKSREFFPFNVVVLHALFINGGLEGE